MPIYLDLSTKSMPSPNAMTHPSTIRHKTESQIENIEMTNQNLAQITMEQRKIKGEKPILTTGRELEARGTWAEGGGKVAPVGGGKKTGSEAAAYTATCSGISTGREPSRCCSSGTKGPPFSPGSGQ